MNQRLPLAGILVAGLGLCYVLFSLMLSGGNQLGDFFGYLLIAALIFGLIQPKISVLLMLAACGYMDWAKRLLVVADKVTQTDLTYVLSLAPGLMAGITLGTLLQAIQGRFRLGWLQVQALLVICFAMSISLVLSIKQSGGLMNALQEVANVAGYSFLLFVIPLLYPKYEEQVRLVRRVIFCYLPVAIYGMYQAAFGLADFEIAYLRTGMSILIGQLLSGEIRPFSTLNSPTALGVICGLLTLLAWASGPLNSRPRRLPTIGMALTGLMFFCGLLASTSRSDFIILIFGSIITWGSLRLNFLRLFYFTSSLAFLGLIISASWLQMRLADIQNFISSIIPPDTAFIESLTRVQTYSDRLEGFRHLSSNAQVWSLFGLSPEVAETIYSHDPLTQSLVSYGLVPVGIAIFFGIILLKRAHGGILRIKDKRERWLAALCLGGVGGILTTSLLGGSRTSIFPVMVFVWLMLSILWSRIEQAARPLSETTKEPHLNPRMLPTAEPLWHHSKPMLRFDAPSQIKNKLE